MSMFFCLNDIFQALNGTSLETPCGTFTFDCDILSQEDNSHLRYYDAEGVEYHWIPTSSKRSSFSHIFDIYREIAEDVEFEELIEI